MSKQNTAAPEEEKIALWLSREKTPLPNLHHPHAWVHISMLD